MKYLLIVSLLLTTLWAGDFEIAAQAYNENDFPKAVVKEGYEDGESYCETVWNQYNLGKH